MTTFNISSTTGDPEYWKKLGGWNYQYNMNSGPAIRFSGIGEIQFPYIMEYQNNLSSLWTSPPSFSTTTTATGQSWSTIYPQLISKHVFPLVTFTYTHLKDKCLIFENLHENTKTIVNREEALKFVWSFFDRQLLTPPTFRDHTEIFYKDEEWHVYFKTAETSEEILEILDMRESKIREILSI